MPSLERFTNPQTRVFSQNITSLPGARLYFFEAGTTTPKITYANKEGAVSNPNPVIADSNGVFPPVFLNGLYRVELRSAKNLTQPGWPIDNVGQDTPIVPYSNWAETITYAKFERVSDPLTGLSYRSKVDNNLGNNPSASPDDWEVIADTIASSFTSNQSYATWSDSSGKISLNLDIVALAEAAANSSGESFTVAAGGDFTGNIHYGKTGKIVTVTTSFLTHPSMTNPSSGVVIPAAYRPDGNITNVYTYSGMGDVCWTAIVTDGGQIFVNYRNVAGNPISRSDIGSCISFSYIKQ